MIKLLLAEDNEFSRDMLMRRLQRQGFEVITAANGREALAAVRRDHPDLILMDLDMPVMDGYAAMRALKNDPRTFRIPIIVVSAHASPEDVAEALASGCQAFEAKPVVLRRLLDRIEETLAASRPTPAPTAPTTPEDPVPAP
ncbi:MAG TPA: response regulator [Bryobacteraceae bacterium]|nr:response regulator [Bryobacteraceae bacterium]